jgi:hypothetical protein
MWFGKVKFIVPDDDSVVHFLYLEDGTIVKINPHSGAILLVVKVPQGSEPQIARG